MDAPKLITKYLPISLVYDYFVKLIYLVYIVESDYFTSTPVQRHLGFYHIFMSTLINLQKPT